MPALGPRARSRVVVAAFATIALATTAACSNPRCWTHDPSEVSGGCSLFSGESNSGGGNFNAESYDANRRRQLAEYQPACDAGDAIACWMVGDAQQSLARPAKEVEASFAAACRGGLGEVPGGHGYVCDRAGVAAELRGGSGPAAAYGHYAMACERGSSSGCAAALRIKPGAVATLAVAACRHGVGAACERAAAEASARGDLARAYAVAVRGCELGVMALCQVVGQRAVTR